MFYDPSRHALVDPETGAVIPISDNDIVPDDIKREIQLKKDHDYAKSLSSSYDEPSRSTQYRESRPSSNWSPSRYNPIEVNDIEIETNTNRNNRNTNSSLNAFPMTIQELKIQEDLFNAHGLEIEQGAQGTNGGGEDWTLARTLQLLEFEIAQETLEGRAMGEEFNEKEYKAGSCKRQILTLSTAILVIQVLQLTCIASASTLNSLLVYVNLIIYQILHRWHF
jgi:hypothetical protein